MLSKLKKSRSEGFTIIEVMIVLAIAALILLIVFLAVPGLQRNSRNTQRKNDVAAILAGVSEFVNNNNGQLPNGPTAWTNNTGLVTIQSGVAGTSSNQLRAGYYNAGIGTANGDINHAVAGQVTAAGALHLATQDYVIISTGTDCNGTASVAASTRSVTAVYEIENGSNSFAQQCESS
jgi:prepilin-type N-terminal cleavage/methylation domain-containing protein